MPKLIKEGVTIIFQDENDTSLERQRHNSEFDFTYYGLDVTIKIENQRLFTGAITSLVDEVDTPFTSATLQTFLGDFNSGGGGTAWGGINGDIQNQTDLVAEFATKQNISIVTQIAFVDSPYAASYDEDLEVDETNGNIIINLPVATGNNGKLLTITKISSGINTITIVPDGSETINDLASDLIANQWTSNIYKSNNTNISKR